MSETRRRDEAERDNGLAALYRASARDEPQPALDSAIRAAARREVGARPQPVGPFFKRSWRAPLAIAAVILLSVSLVTLMREQAPPEISRMPPAAAPLSEAQTYPHENSVAADRIGAGELPPPLAKRAPPAPFPGTSGKRDSNTAAPDEPRQPAKAEARRDVAGATVTTGQQPEAAKPARSADTAAGAPPALRASPQAPGQLTGAAPEPTTEAHREAASSDSAVHEPSRARGQMVPAPSLRSKSLAEEANWSYAKLPPEKWLEQIEELRKQGRLDEARTGLTHFKQRYPDYPIPASLTEGFKP